jgi:sec-independent protein translocase protein TatA
MHLGVGEMLVVLVVALLVFGPNKLPQLGDALGKGIRNFKKAAAEDDHASTGAPTTVEHAQLTAGSRPAPPATAAFEEAAPSPRE